MFKIQFSFIIFAFLFCSMVDAKCTQIFRELVNAQKDFVGCMARYSSPAKSCLSCIHWYIEMTGNYMLLASNATCSQQFLNKNRLQIVDTIQKSSVDIWNKGFCNDCFSNGATISEEISKIQNFSTNFQDCLNTHTNKSQVCSKCNIFYEDLNNLYKKMDEEKKGQICFDIQDEMNQTRSHWSKDLKCCQRVYSLNLFFFASSLFAALPIIFYFGMYGYTKRMERNHEVLDADLDTGHASTSTGLQSGTTPHFEESAHTRDSSSDEDNIGKLKKQPDVSSYDNLSKRNPANLQTGKIIKDIIKPNSSARATSLTENTTLIDL